MRRCFIFGALAVDRIVEAPEAEDYVIAADKGYDVARSLGITPDLTVGDFDSRSSAPDEGDIIRLNVRKDDTDLEHAAAVALDKGFREFVVYGAAGGKLDHTLGNIAVAEMIANWGGRAVFYGSVSSFTVIRNAGFDLPVRTEGRVSVFSLSEVARGVTITGLSYEADGIDLPRAVTRGVSNAFVGRAARVSVADGTLLIVWDSCKI